MFILVYSDDFKFCYNNTRGGSFELKKRPCSHSVAKGFQAGCGALHGLKKCFKQEEIGIRGKFLNYIKNLNTKSFPFRFRDRFHFVSISFCKCLNFKDLACYVKANRFRETFLFRFHLTTFLI